MPPAPRPNSTNQPNALSVRPSQAVTFNAATHPLTRISHHAHRKFPWLLWMLVFLLLLETLLFAGFYGLTVWTEVPLTGSVVDTTGQAVPDALVEAGERRTVTDEFGNFTLHQLPYGTTKVTVSGDNLNESEALVELGYRTGAQTTLTVEPATGGVVEGTLSLLPDVDLAEYTVRVGEVDGVVNAQGVYRVENVPRGPATLTIEAGEQVLTQSLEVESGTNSVPALSFETTSSATLQVVDWYTGESVRGAEVVLPETTATTDAAGQVLLEDWNPNQENTVRLRAPDYADKTVTVSDSRDYTLTLPPAGRLYYTALADGVSRLHEANRDGSNPRALTPADLHVTDLSVEAGRIFLTAYDPDAPRDSFDSPVINVYVYSIEAGTTKQLTDFRGVSPVVGGVARSLPRLEERVTVFIEQTTTGVQVSLQPFDSDVLTPALTLPREADELITVSDAVLSPDGRYLAVLKQVNRAGTTQNSIRLTSLADNSLDQNIIFDDPSLQIQGILGFSEDSNALLFETLEGQRQIIQKFTLGSGGTQEVAGLNLNRYRSKIRGNTLYYLAEGDLNALNLDTLEAAPLLQGFSPAAFEFYGPNGFLLQARARLWYWDASQEFDPALIDTPINFDFLD